MHTPVPTRAVRWRAFGFDRGGAADARGYRVEAVASAGAPGGGHPEGFARAPARTRADPERTAVPASPGAALAAETLSRASRAYGRPDGTRNGRPPSGTAVPVAAAKGRHVDIAA